MSITQAEFDHLLSLEKTFDESDMLILGPPPRNWSRGLTALATRDKFILDFRRAVLRFRNTATTNATGRPS